MIELSKHSIKRAKERFSWNRKTLLRMLAIALDTGIAHQGKRKDSNHYIYGHFNFLVKHERNKVVLVTVTNLQTSASHKEEFVKPTYRRGKINGTVLLKGI